MKKNYFITKSVALICLMSLSILSVKAQSVADYGFTSSAGTYTPITGGSVVGTTTSDDQRFVTPLTPAGGTATTGIGLPIGFNFVLAGNIFDVFAINANGWISLGNSALTPAVNLNSSANYETTLAATSTATPTYLRTRIAGFANDLQGQTGSEIRYETIGTAPNRKLVVQFKGYRKYSAAGDNYNFQIVLLETTNQVQVVYGSMTNGTTSDASQIGLGGVTNADFNTRAVATDYTASTAGATNTATAVVSATVVPATGTTYQWTPSTCGSPTLLKAQLITATSAAVSYTLATLGSPPSYLWQVVPADSAAGVGVVASGSSLNDTAFVIGLTASSAYTFYIQALCGAGDTGGFKSITFTTLCAGPKNIPWVDGFETTVIAVGPSSVNPLCWQSDSLAGASWKSNTTPIRNSIGARTGTKYVYATYNTDAAIYTPELNLIGGTSYELAFWYNNTDVTSPAHNIKIAYGVGQNRAAMTNVLGTLVNTTNTTYQKFQVNFTPSVTGAYSIGLIDSILSFTPWFMVFDDFSVTLSPACLEPSLLTASSVLDTSATITWTSTGITSILEYGAVGFTPGTGTLLYGVSSPTVLTGLTTQTTYQVYVKDSCTGGLVSNNVGPVNFTTSCSPSPYPGDNAGSAKVIASYPYLDTVNTATTTCFTDASTLRVGKDVFYAFTADSCATSLTFSLCGSAFDNYLYIRNAANTVTIASSDDFCGSSAQVTLTGATLTPGASYLAVLEPFSAGVTGEYVVNVTQQIGTNSPTVTTSSVDASCPNSADGSATAAVTANAKSPLTYVWSNGQTTATATALIPGSYFVTVTNGCSGSATASVVVGGDFSVTAAITNVLCPAGNTGAINLTLTGATAPVFAWSNSAVSEDITSLTAGNYSVTITDGVCSFIDTFEVTQPNPIVITVDSTKSVACFGDSTGTIDITVTGGTNNPNLVAQLSTTLTSNNGCTGGNMFDLTTNSGVQITKVDLNLNLGAGPQTVNIYVKPGTYQGFQTTAAAWQLVYTGTATSLGDDVATPIIFPTALTLPAGTYGIYVNADVNYTNIAMGTTYSTPELTLTVGDGLCGNFATTNAGRAWNGNIYYLLPGVPNEYSWSNGDTTEDLTGLTAGTYTLTFTDASGCTSVSAPITVGQPATALAATLDSLKNATCNGGNNGAIAVTVTGGIAPYTFNWSNGSTTEDLTGLGAGSYTGTITDANGCTLITSPITVTEPSLIVVTVDSVVAPSCTYTANGGIYITVTGGTPGYTYAWSNGSSTQDLINVTADSYTGTITDVAGCVLVAGPVTVTAPLAASLTLGSITNVSCAGGNNGAIAVTTTGGTSPYTHNWNNGATLEDLTGLTAGVYSDSITDAKGCVYASQTFTVTQPDSLIVSLDSLVNVKCANGSNGGVYISVTGGTTPYSYLWSNGSAAQDYTGLSSGTVNGTISDAKGCVFSSPNFTITEPAALVVTLDSTKNVSCNTATNGGVSITVVGGTSPYAVVWSNGATNQDLSGLAVGTYTPTVTDANGCTVIGTTATVTQPTALIASATSTNQIQGGTLGTVDVTVSGGTVPYTYAWSNGSATTQDLSGLTANTYIVTVTDANGCTATVSAVVSFTSGLEDVANQFTLNLYPNPTANQAVIDLTLNSTNNVSVTIYNVAGQIIHEYAKEQVVTATFELNFITEAAGVYYAKIKVGETTITKRIIVAK